MSYSDTAVSMSRTQLLISKIPHICQEIHDIKRRKKPKSIDKTHNYNDTIMEKGGKTSLNCTEELGSNNSAKEGNSDGDDWGDTYSSHIIQYHHEPNNPYNLSGV